MSINPAVTVPGTPMISIAQLGRLGPVAMSLAGAAVLITLFAR